MSLCYIREIHVQVNPGDTVMSALRPLGQEWSVAFTDYDFLAFFNTEVGYWLASACWVQFHVMN